VLSIVNKLEREYARNFQKVLALNIFKESGKSRRGVKGVMSVR
jgi:hypothetical protein